MLQNSIFLLPASLFGAMGNFAFFLSFFMPLHQQCQITIHCCNRICTWISVPECYLLHAYNRCPTWPGQRQQWMPNQPTTQHVSLVCNSILNELLRWYSEMHWVVGVILSEPHTSMTALRTRVCMLVGLDRPLTVNFKWAYSNISRWWNVHADL